MERNDRIYNLVYEYYETRILYGFYRLGDKLPSIPKICSLFCMAPATVRVALTLLEKNGYIEVNARRVAQVIYQADTKQYIANASQYFLPRKEGISDLYRCVGLFFKPMWDMGVSRLETGDIPVLLSEILRADENVAAIPVQFYLRVLKKLNNGLILNLYWELLRYIRFPYMSGFETRGITADDLAQCSREEVIARIHQRCHSTFLESYDRLTSFIAQNSPDFPEELEKRVPFNWSIYRQRPQICYSLASRIIRKIIEGEYPIDTYLPSLPRMTEQLGVSLRTLRRTLSLLGSLGVTHSYQGKGTLVCMDISRLDFDQPGVREGLRLHLESLQMMALTIRPVCIYTLEHVSEECREDLIRQFSTILHGQRSSYCFEVMLHFLSEHCPFQAVRNCYGELRDLLAWGYPFTLHRLKNRSLQSEYEAMIRQAAGYLDGKHWEAFAETWRLLFMQEEQAMRCIFLEHV